MGNITHTFNAGEAVWVITISNGCPSAIRKGIIIQVRGVELTTGVSVNYDVRLVGDNGTTTTLESNMYATYAEASATYLSSLGGSPIT